MENIKHERRPQIAIPATPELIEALRDIKHKTGLSQSHIARTALWEKIAEIRDSHPAFAPETVIETVAA